MSPTPDEFREAVSRFATGITVVTCVVDGIDHAMTANAFASVSIDPLLVMVCVERDSRFHEAIAASSDLGGLDSGRLAQSPPPDGSPPRDGPLPVSWNARAITDRRVSGVAWIDGALASLECRTTDDPSRR